LNSFPGDTPLRCIPADYCPSGRPLWYELKEGRDRGKQLFYTDQTIGNGGTPQTLLFVHGNPECSYIFRQTIRSLRKQQLPLTRLITMDHIGFGLSSQATRLMNPADHAANLSFLLANLTPSTMTLVVHDWGGPIGLGALLDQPKLLCNLVILNSTVFPLSERCNYHNYPFSFLSWQRLSSLVPDRYWGRFAAGAIASRAGSRRGLLWELLCHQFKRRPPADRSNPYFAQFASSANVAGSKQLARLAGTWCDATAHDPELNRFFCRLQSETVNCWGSTGTKVQARLLCGEWDPLGDRENAASWLQALPQLAGKMSFVPGGHFIPEHHPEAIAQAIYELLLTAGTAG